MAMWHCGGEREREREREMGNIYDIIIIIIINFFEGNTSDFLRKLSVMRIKMMNQNLTSKINLFFFP